MTHVRTLLTLALPGALLLGACAGGGHPRPGTGTQQEYEAAMRDQSPVRVIVREGPISNSDVGRTPEELARQEAGQQCGRASLDAKVLDVQRQRAPGRDATGGVVQFERVRGDLHDHGVATGRAHLGEKPLQHQGLGGGVGGRQRPTGDFRVNGAQNPRDSATARQHRLTEVSSGSFAIGTRDADQAQRPRWIALGEGCHLSQRASGLGHHQLRNLSQVGQILLDHQGPRPLFHDLGGKVVSIDLKARYTDKQVSSCDLS